MTFTWHDGAISQATSGVTTISVTLSAAVSAGDLILCTTGAPSFVIGDVSDTAGNTWVQIGSTVAHNSMFACLAAVAAAGGTTITVAHSGSSGTRFLSADRFTPSAPAVYTGNFSSSTTTGTSGNAGSITGDPGGNLLYNALHCGNSTLTFTAGSSNGVTATLNEQTGNTGGSGFSQFITSTAAGTQSMTWSASGTVNSNNSSMQATFSAGGAPVQQYRTAPRRKPARGAWRGAAVPGVSGVAPRQQYRTAPRRVLARAYVRFIPVTTTNAVPAPPPSGTVQPRATVPVPRRQPGRGVWRGTAVPGMPGTAPRQQYQTAPRRKPARAFIWFTPVAGSAAPVVAAARPLAGDGTESRLIRRYRRMLRRHDVDPDVALMAAPVAVQVPPGWPGTWPVPPLEPAPPPELAPPPEPSRPPRVPVYVRPPKRPRKYPDGMDAWRQR